MIEAILAVMIAISGVLGGGQATLDEYRALDSALDRLNIIVEQAIIEAEKTEKPAVQTKEVKKAPVKIKKLPAVSTGGFPTVQP
jgi:hypothetical protein